MFQSSLIVFVISILTSFWCVPCQAQEKPASSAPTVLGIQVVHDGPRLPLPVTEDGYCEIGPPPRRPDWMQPPDTPPLTRIRIRSALERDGVRIRIAAVLDDSQPANAPGPKYGAREQAMASGFGLEGATITFSETGRFGFEPLVLKIVRYAPDPMPQSSAKLLPEVINELKSIAVLDLQSAEPASQSYSLTMQNVGAKSIVAFALGFEQSHTETIEGGVKPILLPGATLKTFIGGFESSTSETPRPTLVITTVLFDDGAYEGDMVTAAELAARSKGRQIQSARCLRLVDRLVDQSPEEIIKAIPEIRTAVEQLRIDVDATIVEQLQSQFPLLPKANDKSWLADKIMDGLKAGRSMTIFGLNDLEQRRARDPNGFDLKQSLAKLRERIARFAGPQ
jgi:hypothetical protein